MGFVHELFPESSWSEEQVSNDSSVSGANPESLMNVGDNLRFQLRHSPGSGLEK